ncbi:MAG: lactate racemase domain-containing protein [Candidatus Thorarchaeota archaeon]|jgi:nickel-dependent lactate racemase
MEMRVDLRYGEGSLPLELSDRFSIEQIIPQTVTKHPDIASELLRVIESPTDSLPFSQRVSEVASIAIVVNRIENQEIIEGLLHSLLNSVETFSFNPDNVSIFYPIKSSDRMSKTEVDHFLGNPESRGHLLILHNPTTNSSLKLIGETPSYSTPVHVNEAYLCADMKIGLGEIRPDVFFGATGGRMSVVPSVSGKRTINRNAKLRTTKDIGQFNLETPSCVDMMEISQLAGLDYIINSVSDWQGNLAHIVAGDSNSSWNSGVESAKRLAKAEFSRRADIAIVSAGGNPHDSTLYDAIDSLYPACEVTEYGGSIVLVAECDGEVGPKGFIRSMSEFSSEEDVLTAAETSFEVGMEKARFFWNVLSSRKIVICSRLRESLVEERFHCIAVKDPQEGFEAAQSMLASSKKVAILSDGLRSTPKLASH